MAAKRKVEVFSAGCAACEDTLAMVRRAACPSCEVIVHDMNDIDVVKRAKALEKTPGVKSAKVDFPTKSAVVEYDPRVTSPERLLKSTANAGYPSAVKSGN